MGLASLRHGFCVGGNSIRFPGCSVDGGVGVTDGGVIGSAVSEFFSPPPHIQPPFKFPPWVSWGGNSIRFPGCSVDNGVGVTDDRAIGSAVSEFFTTPLPRTPPHPVQAEGPNWNDNVLEVADSVFIRTCTFSNPRYLIGCAAFFVRPSAEHISHSLHSLNE